jgi:hypothetical protein
MEHSAFRLERRGISRMVRAIAMNAAAEAEQPVSPAVLEMARQAVRDFHECFWWWNPQFQPRSSDDVREIVDNLRKAGNPRSWAAAQHLIKCL